MNLKNVPPLPYFFYTIGVILLVAGGGIWWYQNRAIQTLDDPLGHVGLAVVVTQAPRTATPTPTSTMTPVLTDSAVVLTPASTLPTPTFSPTPDPFPPAQNAPTRLVIPKINVDTVVVRMLWEYKEGGDGSVFTEWAVPEAEAGWHVSSALPGTGSNVVVSGHHNVGVEVFRHLEQLEPGDEALIYADEREYRYIVEEKYILREEGMPLEIRQKNNEYIIPTDDERLTLVSCWPYETNSHRIVIVARPALSS